jgi:transposase
MDYVDTCADQSVTTDALGRRSGPRRQYTLDEKRQIVQETHVRGASVAVVARRHDLNPNQVFAWRRLYRQGLLKADAAQGTAELLPVKVSTPTVMPSERAARAPKEPAVVAAAVPSIEIKLANGHSLIVRGDVEAKHLTRVLDVLARR